ncbi:hypothetical protein E2320_013452 [Naja naja]|nr:hypothetical protein E2320_013452 [Naja naja]
MEEETAAVKHVFWARGSVMVDQKCFFLSPPSDMVRCSSQNIAAAEMMAEEAPAGSLKMHCVVIENINENVYCLEQSFSCHNSHE